MSADPAQAAAHAGGAVTALCEAIAPLAGRARRRAAERVPRAGHAALAGELEVLHTVEDRRLPAAEPADWPVEIAFWNVERGRHLDGISRRLAALDPAVALLCELDLGMARSAQRHTTEAVGTALGAGHLFGVEFVELGLGDPRERAMHAGEENAHGLHGAAIVSRFALERPAMVRIELDGEWFDGRRGEPRVGGRIALLATLRVGAERVVLASVHLESHGDPDGRARQMRAVLEGIEAYAPGAAVLVGGDFNTQSAPREDTVDDDTLARLLAADHGRLLDPVPHEPLFEVARTFGYEWTRCNVAGAGTTRAMPHHPPRPPRKLDWFFARGVAARDPRVLEAVDPDTGAALSDHELLAITLDGRTP